MTNILECFYFSFSSKTLFSITHEETYLRFL